ncbi:Sec24-like protein [Giardia muris]|uniref:Sec24-like protein n=1 Tax=Giardia muris TaxID=5742 RepID=A0A4Z1SNT2_GIAMU|nr:Sec24-like protein [Giardia muris]|eukprot:TNJ27462.1 Sec24-like protein [Giardia muris]
MANIKDGQTPVRQYTQKYPSGQHVISGDSYGALPLEVFAYAPGPIPSPRNLSCTLSVIPYADPLLLKTSLPLAIHLSPLAEPDNLSVVGGQSTSVPLIHTAPTRCQRCRAYMSPHNELFTEKWVCALCGRSNPYPSGRNPPLSFNPSVNRFVLDQGRCHGEVSTWELVLGTVEYDVSADPAFLPASTDDPVFFMQQGAPGDVSHVQAAILAPERFMEGNAVQASAQGYGEPSTICATRFEGQQLNIPSAEYVQERRVPSATPRALTYVLIVLIPATTNAFSNGVLKGAFDTLLGSLSAIPESVRVVPVLYNEALQCFRRVGGSVEKVEEVVMRADFLTTEPILPYPIEELALSRDVQKEFSFFQKVLTSVYAGVQDATKRGMKMYASSSFVVALAGCISTLQHTGGKIIGITCDPVQSGLASTPCPEVPVTEFSVPSIEMLFLSHDAIVNRLAYMAATHNTGIDIIALPTAKTTNLSIPALSAFCSVTGGALLYYEAGLYASNMLGGLTFLANALRRQLLSRQGIAATLSIRTSEGFDVRMNDATPEALATNAVRGSLTTGGFANLFITARNLVATKLQQRNAEADRRPAIENLLQLSQQAPKAAYKWKSKDGFSANYLKQSALEYCFATITEHDNYSMELKYNAKIPATSSHGYVQTALLYTAMDGSRRVRVSTLPLMLDNRLSEIYMGINQLAYVGWLAKKLALRVLSTEALMVGCLDALGGDFDVEKPITTTSSTNHEQGAEIGMESSYTHPKGTTHHPDVHRDEVARTGHASELTVQYLTTRMGPELVKRQTLFNAQRLTLLFDGEYSYNGYLSNGRVIERAVYPLIREFRNCTYSATVGSLSVPAKLELLPLYALGLTRTALCHRHRSEGEGGMYFADERHSFAYRVLSAPAHQIALMLYPTLYDCNSYLTTFVPEVERWALAHPGTPINMPVSLPVPIRTGSRHMRNITKTVFLLASEGYTLLWVGLSLDVQLRMSIFGVKEHKDLGPVRPYGLYLERSNEQTGQMRALSRLIDVVQRLHGCLAPVLVVPEGLGGGLEALARWALVEDQTSQDRSHSEFLSAMAQAIIDNRWS